MTIEMARILARRTLDEQFQGDPSEPEMFGGRELDAESRDVQLSKPFDFYASEQIRNADRLRLFCILSLISMVGMAAILLLVIQNLDVEAQLAHLGLVVPLGILAAYLARESAAHRSTGHWAKSLAVQLQTVRVYLADLPADVQAEIRVAFSNKVFGEQPGTNINQE